MRPGRRGRRRGASLSVTVTPVWPPPDGKADSRVRVVVTSVRLYPDISSDGYPYI